MTRIDADPARAAADAAAVGAITGVLAIDDYRAALCQAGLVDATVTATAQVGEVTHSAILQARRPRD